MNKNYTLYVTNIPAELDEVCVTNFIKPYYKLIEKHLKILDFICYNYFQFYFLYSNLNIKEIQLLTTTFYIL